MPKSQFDDIFVDRYLRDELSAEEQAAFEEALLEDPELQSRVETALGIREVLSQAQALGALAAPRHGKSRNQWAPLAMAASVLLAVVSATLLWRTNLESNELQAQIEALQQPRTSVLRVPVDIMRSSGNATPDVVIQKPASNGLVVLDIELSPDLQNVPLVHFELRQGESAPIMRWSSRPGPNGRSSVAINAEALPPGLVHLYMSDEAGELRESRLLEFRQ